MTGLPRWLSGKESACSAGDASSVPGGQEGPLEEGMATHSVFFPGKSHGQRSLEGYSPRGRTESDRRSDWTAATRGSGGATPLEEAAVCVRPLGRVCSGVIARAGQGAHLAFSALCERRQAGRTHSVFQGREKGRPGVRRSAGRTAGRQRLSGAAMVSGARGATWRSCPPRISRKHV